MVERGSKQLELDRAIEVSLAIDEFVAAAGIRRKAFAAALQLDPAEVSQSHFERSPLALFWSLRDSQLPGVAARLQLPDPQFSMLQNCARRVQEAVCGRRSSTDIAADQAEWAIRLYAGNDWSLALSHLEAAWTTLTTNGRLDPTHRHFKVTVDAGVQLLDWLVHQGAVRPACDIAAVLIRAIGQAGAVHRETSGAIAGAHRSIAIALRRQAQTSPRQLARRSDFAYQILSDFDCARDTQIAALRDQAKPLAVRGLGWWRYGAPEPHLLDEAGAKLALARSLAGGPRPRDDLFDQWVFTEVTWIHHSRPSWSDATALRGTCIQLH